MREPRQIPSGTGYDLCICVYAEQNALLAAARFGIPVAGRVRLLPGLLGLAWDNIQMDCLVYSILEMHKLAHNALSNK